MPRRRDGAYYVFHDYDLRAVCDNRRAQMKVAIENADGDAIRSGDLDLLIQAYVAQFALDMPQLAEGATSVEVEEAESKQAFEGKLNRMKEYVASQIGLSVPDRGACDVDWRTCWPRQRPREAR